MPVTVYKLADESILVATFSGEIDAKTIHEMFIKSAEILGDDPSPVYRITDFRLMTTTPMAALAALAEAASNGPGSTSDARIRAILLGNNQWSRLAQKALEQYQLVVYETMGDALRHARQQLARHSGHYHISDAS